MYYKNMLLEMIKYKINDQYYVSKCNTIKIKVEILRTPSASAWMITRLRGKSGDADADSTKPLIYTEHHLVTPQTFTHNLSALNSI